jgi:nitroimidazol reductase NimA-like FMN-containing flavoprotein (pyridoxamine 5'-phosphate oxidase superfamily)
MNRRAQIRMTAEEQATFLRTAPKASLATIGQDGFPHVVAMSFLAKDGRIYMRHPMAKPRKC